MKLRELHESDSLGGWVVSSTSYTTKGADPTSVTKIKLKKGIKQVELEEFQGVYKVTYKADVNNGSTEVNSFHVSFGGSDGKKLDAYLRKLGAPDLETIENKLNLD